MNSRRSSKINFKMIPVVTILMIIAVFLSTDIIRASSFKQPSFGNKHEIVQDLDSFTPDTSSYPFNQDGITAAPLTELWGNSKSMTKYLGEIPYSLKDEEDLRKFRVSSGDTIDGNVRPWAKDSGLSVENITESSEDLHIRAMAEHTDSQPFGVVIYYIGYAVYSVSGLLLNILMKLKDVDMLSILEIFNDDGRMQDVLNNMFLMTKDGYPSVFLVIMISLFLMSLVGVAVRAMKGSSSFSLAGREFAMLMLAALVAGLSLAAGTQTTIAKWGIEITTHLSNSIVSSAARDSELFVYDTGEPVKDSNMTQMALLEKPSVDSFIASQFGVSVGELDIIDKSGSYTDNFGKGTAKAVSMTFSKGDFAVNSGAGDVHNLGYYWWAANSKVSEKHAIKGEGAVNNASNMRYLYIVDFLNNARKIAVNNGEDKVVSKIDKIMTSLWAPGWTSAGMNLLMISFLKVSLLYSFYLVIVFMTIGKIIVSIGIFAVPVMPGLILLNKTRSFAKMMVKAYLMGFARYVIGIVVLNVIIVVVASIASQGTPGVLTAAIVAILIGRTIPKLMIEINRRVARKDAHFMSWANKKYTSYSKMAIRNRDKNSKSKIEYDKNGNLVSVDNSTKHKVAEGFSGLRALAKDGTDKIKGVIGLGGEAGEGDNIGNVNVESKGPDAVDESVKDSTGTKKTRFDNSNDLIAGNDSVVTESGSDLEDKYGKDSDEDKIGKEDVKVNSINVESIDNINDKNDTDDTDDVDTDTDEADDNATNINITNINTEIIGEEAPIKKGRVGSEKGIENDLNRISSEDDTENDNEVKVKTDDEIMSMLIKDVNSPVSNIDDIKDSVNKDMKVNSNDKSSKDNTEASVNEDSTDSIKLNVNKPEDLLKGKIVIPKPDEDEGPKGRSGMNKDTMRQDPIDPKINKDSEVEIGNDTLDKIKMPNIKLKSEEVESKVEDINIEGSSNDSKTESNTTIPKPNLTTNEKNILNRDKATEIKNIEEEILSKLQKSTNEDGSEPVVKGVKSGMKESITLRSDSTDDTNTGSKDINIGNDSNVDKVKESSDSIKIDIPKPTENVSKPKFDKIAPEVPTPEVPKPEISKPNTTEVSKPGVSDVPAPGVPNGVKAAVAAVGSAKAGSKTRKEPAIKIKNADKSKENVKTEEPKPEKISIKKDAKVEKPSKPSIASKLKRKGVNSAIKMAQNTLVGRAYFEKKMRDQPNVKIGSSKTNHSSNRKDKSK